MKKILLVHFAVVAAVGVVTAQVNAADLRQITVDDTVTGTLKTFNGVTGAPGAGFGDLQSGQPGPDTDVSAAYRAARIDVIRTHDTFGPSDIDAHFGVDKSLPAGIPSNRDALDIFPDMAADVEDPKSYNFAPTDRLLASIKAVHAEPIFRIGRSIGASPQPPADLAKYAQIVRHIVLHYNKGWDHGFHYGVRYWEIWNEPDFKVFWTGTPQQYYEPYERTARAIKAADSGALVGGPTISLPLDATAYREGFLDFVRVRKLPLDFFSWHFYTLDSNDPNNFITIAKEIRSILDAHGFKATRSVLDEWNGDLFDRDVSKAARAAFAVSSLIYMLDAPIDVQAYYRADADFRGAGNGPDQVAHALTVFGMMKDTPVLLHDAGADDQGFAVLAGRSADSRTFQVLISNYQIAGKYLGKRPNGDRMRIPNIMDITLPARRALAYHDNAGYDLRLTVPAGEYQITRYRITDSENFVRVDQNTQPGPALHLQAPLPAPGIEYLKIEAL
jgi:xylan 1,4-beta-xylosidase